MKKCPKCQSLFDDDNSFCLNDGTLLAAEAPTTAAYNLPPTIQQHNAPFVVDLSPKPEIPTQFTPIPPVSSVQPPKKSSNNYAAPLLIGLLLGGVIVLALFFIIRGLDEKETAVINNSNNSSPTKNDNSTNSDNKNTKKSSTNDENNNSTNKIEKPANVNSPNVVFNANTKKDSKYNGRVIMLNAYIRSAPDAYADEVDVLPLNDRINIGKRASPNSPWYRVTCEHGTSGWMHGNTIEFTR